MSVKKVFFDNDQVAVEPEMIRLDEIKVLECKSLPDSSYTETVALSFSLCDSKGGINGANIDNLFHIVLEIATGYRPEIDVETDLRRDLEPFKIFDLDTLMSAFRYRRFYCKF